MLAVDGIKKGGREIGGALSLVASGARRKTEGGAVCLAVVEESKREVAAAGQEKWRG